MSFVDFMIVGAQKCGTSTLAQILSMHPNICFSKIKEPHFFSKSPNWQDCIEDYKALYQPKDNQICGEASTTYTCYPEFNKDIWNSLHQFNPNLKLIYLMKDPVKRIVSHWMHNYLRGYTSKPFKENILTDPSYLNRTRYFIQIKPYLDLFTSEQVLLLSFEEFIQDKNLTLQNISNFLKIEFSKFNDFEKVYANPSLGFSKDNIKLEAFINSNFITSIKPYFPSFITDLAYKKLRALTDKKLDRPPEVSDELKKVIWDLLILDILEIEKLMGRKLSEWNPHFS